MIHEIRRKRLEAKQAEQDGGRGGRGFRGGRGRGDRGGRGGRGRGGRGGKDNAREVYDEDQPVVEQKSSLAPPEERLAAFLGYVSDFIKAKLDNNELQGDFLYARNQLYQMYFVMARLDAAKFCKLDFIVNFGVPPDVKSKMTDLLRIGADSDNTNKYLEKLDPFVLLKLHKYFFWADKKLHSVFFIEDKDQISEDLLADFKGEEDQIITMKDKKPGDYYELEKEDTGPKVIQMGRGKRITKTDLMGGNNKKKRFIAINDDEDFPELDEDEDDPFAGLDSKPAQSRGAVPQKKVTNIDDQNA